METKKEERVAKLVMKVKSNLHCINYDLIRGDVKSAEVFYKDLFQACRILQNICLMDGWEERFDYLVRH